MMNPMRLCKELRGKELSERELDMIGLAGKRIVDRYGLHNVSQFKDSEGGLYFFSRKGTDFKFFEYDSTCGRGTVCMEINKKQWEIENDT